LKEKEAGLVMERMGAVNWSPEKDDGKPRPPAAASTPAPAAPIKEVSAM